MESKMIVESGIVEKAAGWKAHLTPEGMSVSDTCTGRQSRRQDQIGCPIQESSTDAQAVSRNCL
jgi:hypothetical protein